VEVDLEARRGVGRLEHTPGDVAAGRGAGGVAELGRRVGVDQRAEVARLGEREASQHDRSDLGAERVDQRPVLLEPVGDGAGVVAQARRRRLDEQRQALARRVAGGGHVLDQRRG